MNISGSISRAILIIFLFSNGIVHADAQDNFDVDDASAYSGYRGYTTYHQSTRDDVQTDAVPKDYTPQPILNLQYNDDLVNDGVEIRPLKNPIEKKDTLSRIENFYRTRTGDENLSQYGYDLFYSANIISQSFDENLKTTPAGAVQDGYILQAGDEINIIFSGERRDRQSYVISSDGRLLIEGLNPINAMGRSLGQLKNDIALAKQSMNYRGDIDVSVSAIRQIGVLIAGHVEKPGRHNLNAFQSVFDVIGMAGGIRKSGSLRNIKLIRNGKSQYIDLYDFIVFELPSNDMRLQDGDRIIVPSLGPTFAAVGDVKQAGIFELKTHNAKPMALSMNDAMRMAGGVLGGGDYNFTITRGSGHVTNVGGLSKVNVDDGSIITATRATDRMDNAVELRGYSRQNGIYDLNDVGTLYQLLGNGQKFGDDIYPLIGVVSRINRDNLTRQLMGFSPQAIAAAKDDRQLESGDVVYLFSNNDIYNIFNKSNKNNGINKYSNNIIQFIIDNGVTIQGAVRNEGVWPVGVTTDLQTLVSVAGGLTAKANTTDIEITSRNVELGNTHRRQKIDVKDMRLADVMLEAGDQVRIQERYEQAVEKTVSITGEVKHPGQYDLMRGDTLSSLIKRAGGLTPDAYPPAAVFSRKNERKREEQKFRAAAQELERTVSVNLNAVDKGASLTPSQISMARQLADDLRAVQAVGRVTVEADPAVLEVKPELDMMLDDGDRLHIPKRTLTVRVSGEVMNPASLLFHDSKDVDDYLNESGGLSYYADKGRVFVVYPDGSAQPLRGSWASQKTAMVIPGSTIIVPRDPKPFNFMDSFKDITQILTNIAITGVFVEDIANDEN